MISDLPNFYFVGYTNASWTLKSDLTSSTFHMLFYLEKHQYSASKSCGTNLQPVRY
jgi:hypothetical protein